MKPKPFYMAFALILLLALNGVIVTSAVVPTPAPAALAQQAIIIDHTCTDLSRVPASWIQQAKAQLRLFYGHTSHGSQPVSGMGVLMSNTPSGLYDFNTDGAIQPGVLSLDDHYGDMGDLGHYGDLTWADNTRTYLNGSGNDRNVVIWSWCGGVSDNTEEGINAYLNAMNQLETEYPGVTFVYMTGHLDGTGTGGNLNVRNDQIRDYCQSHGKVLFDFADIESYDPDGDTDYLALYGTDGCEYDSDGDQNPWGDANWAIEWCDAHPGDPLCEWCDCAHSEALNCNLKARAFWWMLARLAGWDGVPGGGFDLSPSFKAASPSAAGYGEQIAYTIVVHNASGSLSPTIYVSDTIPNGLAYVSGTLTATSGTADDSAAPALYWSGELTPTAVVTITYAVTVSEAAPAFLVNTATIAAPGYPPLSRTAAVLVNGRRVYLPLVMKGSTE